MSGGGLIAASRPDGVPRRTGDSGELEFLFDAELRYRDTMSEIVPPKGRQGRLIGSGDGSVSGPQLAGRLSWTLFEELGDTLAVIDHALVLDTFDGARVRFDAQGFARRPGVEHPYWTVAGALSFAADDSRYAWLDGRLALWKGGYDGTTRRAHYRAYASGLAATHPPQGVVFDQAAR